MKTSAENNEQDIGNGLTNKSNLYITIYEAKDLNSCGLTGECNSFVQITFQGNVQNTSVKQNDFNPVWDENFKFKINSLGDDEKIKFEILCKTFFGEKSLGSITINLNNLIDQDEMEKLFDLNPGNGKIRMKLKCILNLVWVAFNEEPPTELGPLLLNREIDELDFCIFLFIFCLELLRN